MSTINDLKKGDIFFITTDATKYFEYYLSTRLTLVKKVEGMNGKGQVTTLLSMVADYPLAVPDPGSYGLYQFPNINDLQKFWMGKPSGSLIEDWKVIPSWNVVVVGHVEEVNESEHRYCSCGGKLEWVALAERCPACWRVYT